MGRRKKSKNVSIYIFVCPEHEWRYLILTLRIKHIVNGEETKDKEDHFPPHLAEFNLKIFLGMGNKIHLSDSIFCKAISESLKLIGFPITFKQALGFLRGCHMSLFGLFLSCCL